MKVDEIERLIQLVADNDINTLELKRGGMEIRISKNGEARVAVATGTGSAGPVQVAPPTRLPAQEASAPESDESEDIEDQAGIEIIKATMVGTFYRSSSPGADPFLEVGQPVRKGQVICIIEAMKIMNEIEAEISGTVRKIFVEDAQPVEYGEPLFAVETD